MDIKSNYPKCKTCKFRNEDGDCTNEKISDNGEYHTYICEDDEDKIEREDKIKDMLLYSYNEGGSFYVGEEFGCVHYEEK